MAVRPIDGNELYRIEKLLDTDIVRQDKVALNLLEQVLYDIQHAPTLAPPPITGDTSDGYHTFNELYHHRAVLFSVICNEHPDIAWKSKKHHDGTMYDGMFIVGVNTPEGQATYHYDIDPYWDSFRVKELEFAPEWDGHTPAEAIRRIGALTPPNETLTLDSRLTSKMVTCPKGWKGVRGTRFYCPGCKKAVKKGEAYCHKCGQALIFPVQRYDKENNRIWLDFSNRRPPEGETDA